MPLPTLRNAIAGDLDKVFDRFWSDWNLPLTVELPAAPSLDLYEKDGTYFIDLAVPGYVAQDIDVDVAGNMLTLTGKYDTTVKNDDWKYHRREIRRGAFERTVTLPLEIDPASVAAKVERGILTISAKPMKMTANTKIKVTGT